MTFCVCIGFLHCLIGCLSTILKFKGLTTVTFWLAFFVIGIVRKAIVESGLLDRMIHKIDLARVRSGSFDAHADGKIESLGVRNKTQKICITALSVEAVRKRMALRL